jgi:hypothetical protein
MLNLVFEKTHISSSPFTLLLAWVELVFFMSTIWNFKNLPQSLHGYFSSFWIHNQYGIQFDLSQVEFIHLPNPHCMFAKFTSTSQIRQVHFAKSTSSQVHIAKSSSSHLQVANTTLLSRTPWMCFELPTLSSISRLLTTWNFDGWIQIWWMNQLTPFIGLI